MSTKKKGEVVLTPKLTENCPTTRIKPDVLSMAKYVASRRGITLFEYLDGMLRFPVTRDFRAEQVHV